MMEPTARSPDADALPSSRRPEAGDQARQAWSSLFELFARGGDDPARAYEHHRARLVKFFAFRAWPNPDVLADRTLDRVGQALAAGAQIQATEPSGYVLGVARNVHLEAVRAEVRMRGVLDELAADASGEPDAIDVEGRLAALERCLAALADDERALVLRYYGFSGEPGRDHRIRLAAELRLEVNALRMRIHRLCGRLLDCVKACAHEHA